MLPGSHLSLNVVQMNLYNLSVNRKVFGIFYFETVCFCIYLVDVSLVARIVAFSR